MSDDYLPYVDLRAVYKRSLDYDSLRNKYEKFLSENKFKIIEVPYDENQCDISGCLNIADEYVLLRFGAVHLCKTHAAQHRLQADKSGLDTTPEVIPSK